jgi:hypothetical protein
MKTVPLGGVRAAGRVALVDDADYDLVMTRKWHLLAGHRPDTVYAATSFRYPDGSSSKIKMNTFITGWGMTDHVNGDGLDNRRSNLRPATDAQNQGNRKPTHGKSSQYKGVSRIGGGKWRASIMSDYKSRNLGHFRTEMEAALVYDAAAREVFGEFARPNFPGRSR